MKNLNYKGKGEHSVNELELIINQQAEELHLFNSGQKQLNLSGVSQQRELLIDLLDKLEKGGSNRFVSKEWIVDNYLQDN